MLSDSTSAQKSRTGSRGACAFADDDVDALIPRVAEDSGSPASAMAFLAADLASAELVTTLGASTAEAEADDDDAGADARANVGADVGAGAGAGAGAADASRFPVAVESALAVSALALLAADSAELATTYGV